MADETIEQTTETAEAPNTATAAGQTSGAGDAEPRFTQADINKMIGERLEQERRKAAKEAEKAQAEAERKALAENQQWKELAEKTAQELQTARAAAERVERVDELVKSMYDARTKTLPAALRKAVESLPVTDPLDRLKWLDENEALFRQTTSVPDINAGQAQQGRPATLYGGLDPNELAARLNLDPRYLPKG